MLKAFNDHGFLEKLTGLDQLHEEGEAALESLDWEEEEGEDDFWSDRILRIYPIFCSLRSADDDTLYNVYFFFLITEAKIPQMKWRIVHWITFLEHFW